MTNRDDVARIALLLPEVAESDSEFAFAVAGKKFVSLWRERVDPKKSKVGNAEVIVVHVGGPGGEGGAASLRPGEVLHHYHYDGYQGVLVSLPTVDVGELTELITDSWLLQAPTRLVEELERG